MVVQERGSIEVKGSGRMTTFFVLDDGAGSSGKVSLGSSFLSRNVSDDHDQPSRTSSFPAVSGDVSPISPHNLLIGNGSRKGSEQMGILNEPGTWRSLSEIGRVVRTCVKVVTFLDTAYLSSFNSMQEIALALANDKPIAPVVLDQEAITMLSSPEGLDRAWSAMQSMEGRQLTPGLNDGCPLTKKWLESTFVTLFNSNLCMCRVVDFPADGERVVFQRMQVCISFGLDYQREHALLQSRALEWKDSGKSNAFLLKKKIVSEKKVWLARALEMKFHPIPTPEQQDFVDASNRQVRRRALWKQVS